MKKLFIVILILIILNTFSICYLKRIINSRHAYAYQINKDIFIIPKKMISLYEKDEFTFDDHFKVLSFDDYSYNYAFTDYGILRLALNDREFDFDYTIKEKEVIEKIIYEEKPVYINSYITNNDDKTQDKIPNRQENQNTDAQPYFRLNTQTLTYDPDTDINRIISDFYNCFDSNVSVMIDYSSLNPSVPGQYDIYFLHDDSSSRLIVNIRDNI